VHLGGPGAQGARPPDDGEASPTQGRRVTRATRHQG